jgi:hypothetical protein
MNVCKVQGRYYMHNTLNQSLIDIGYFLSRLGYKSPPPQLHQIKWKQAYETFYHLDNRNLTVEEFKNSLKNIRDRFDGYCNNTRQGWREENAARNPKALPRQFTARYEILSQLNDQQLWQHIQTLINQKGDHFVESVNQYTPEFEGIKYSPAIEDSFKDVQHGRIVSALKDHLQLNYSENHIYNTQKVDLIFDSMKYKKILFEVKTNTDTQSIYTAIGQLSYHGLDYQNHQKYIVLPACGYDIKLIEKLNFLSIQTAWYSMLYSTYNFSNLNL